MAKNLYDLWDEGWKPKKGKTFYFGNYHGDIKWIVLNVEDDRMLAISKNVLDWLPFDENGNNDWQNCSLRKWLNEVFANEALCDGESIEDYWIFDKTEIGDYVSLLNISVAEGLTDLLRRHGSPPSTFLELLHDPGFYGNWYDLGNLSFWLMPESGMFTYVDAHGIASTISDSKDDQEYMTRNGICNDFAKPLGVRPLIWLKTDPDFYG